MQETTNTKSILLFISIAYLFSFLIRLIWVYQFQGNPQFMWNDQLMINTNDGYFFASGAQKWLEGTLQHNPRTPELFMTAAVTFSAFIAKFTPLSLDTAVLYMPAIISSLVVIPIILIGRLFGMTRVGFFAALLGSIAWSYYNIELVILFILIVIVIVLSIIAYNKHLPNISYKHLSNIYSKLFEISSRS